MSYAIDVRAFTDSISDRALEQLCRENPELKFETDTKGKLIVISPTGSLTGGRNVRIQEGVEENKQCK